MKRLLILAAAALAFGANADGPNPRIAYTTELEVHRISSRYPTIDGTIHVNLAGGFIGTYTASLSCPAPLLPKDASQNPFTVHNAVAVSEPTIHVLTVPNANVTGHARTVWRCALRVTVYNTSGEKALDDFVPVIVRYNSAEQPTRY